MYSNQAKYTFAVAAAHLPNIWKFDADWFKASDGYCPASHNTDKQNKVSYNY